MGAKISMRSSLVDRFNQVLEFARKYGIPLNRKENILREYLQSLILNRIYQKKQSANLFFIGGTSLRLLRGLDRFSEDLDFEFVSPLNYSKINDLLKEIEFYLQKENISVSLYTNKTLKRVYFEFRFSKILYELKLDSDQEKKLVIKLDFESNWKGLSREIISFDRYGFLSNIVTVSLNQLLIQKLLAYIDRKQTMARDLYDIVWLLSNNAVFDWQFIEDNNITDLTKRVKDKFYVEKNKLNLYKRRLESFLLDPENVNKLDFLEIYFPKMINLEYVRYDKIVNPSGEDIIVYRFFFKLNKQREIIFSIKIAESALAGFKKSFEKNQDNLNFYIKKIKEFYCLNPIKNYETKVIDTRLRKNLEKGEINHLI
ncbi:MAG: nucleotidyl transferase AbiEii/AbiGii toxin family protein [Microgenomates group bacterium]|nr:nucleotidyl transferase AbiEii/AbiGii toxin family protein [Microgenomates group bacterium]